MLRPFPFGVVEDVPFDLVQFAPIIDMTNEVFDDVDRFAVPTFPPALEAVDLSFSFQPLQQRFPLSRVEVQIQNVRPNRILGEREPEYRREGRIAQENPPLGRADEIPRQVVLEQPVITLLALAQGLLVPPFLRDVVEEDGDFSALRPADSEGIDVVPAVQGLRLVHKAGRLARHRNPAIRFEPMRFMIRSKLAHPSPFRSVQSGLLLKCRIDIQETVIGGPALVVKNHLDDTEPLVDRIEQGSILFFALAQGPLHLLAFRDVAEQDGQVLRAGVGVNLHHSIRDHRGGLDVDGLAAAYGPAKLGFEAGADNVGKNLPEHASQHLFPGLVEIGKSRIIDVGKPPVAIESIESVGDAAHDDFKPLTALSQGPLSLEQFIVGDPQFLRLYDQLLGPNLQFQGLHLELYVHFL